MCSPAVKTPPMLSEGPLAPPTSGEAMSAVLMGQMRRVLTTVSDLVRLRELRLSVARWKACREHDVEPKLQRSSAEETLVAVLHTASETFGRGTCAKEGLATGPWATTRISLSVRLEHAHG